MTNIWKRSLSMFLAMVMVFGMLPVNALAAETAPETTEATSATEAVASTVETSAETTEAPETTAAPTEAPTEAPVVTEETTGPSEGTEETGAPTEETTETSQETTAPTEETTEPSEETSEPTEEAEETTEPSEETEPEETVPEETGAVATRESYTAVPGMELPSDEDLFAGYAENVFYGNGPAVLGSAAGEQLSGDLKAAYDALVPVLHAIASGERASTTVTVGHDLGYVQFDDGSEGTFDAEVDAAFTGTIFDQEDLDTLLAALLADMPYELYWFDKVTGLSDIVVVSNSRMHITFQFTVAKSYRGADSLTANTSLTGAAADTAAAAHAVVKQVAADENVKTDYDILLAYKDWICAATSYNTSAANSNNFVTDCDPWQMIYVFDGKASTTVVCEGYSKAFQYLCDLTEFEDEDAECYSVTGNFKSGTVNGAHMWNIVKLDGAYYLVDVTNSDTNTVGDDGSLFMVGTTPNTSGSYTFGASTYTYDETTEALWANTAVLTMSSSSYAPVNAEASEGMTQAMLEEELAAAKEAGAYYALAESFTLEDDLTIDLSNNGYVYPFEIPEGVTLTVPSGVTLTLNGPMQIYGELIIEDGAALEVGNSDMWGNLYLTGDLTIGSNAKLTFSEYGVIYVDTTGSSTITGTVPKEYLYGQYIAKTEAQLLAALAETEYSGHELSGHDIYVQGDIALTKNLTIGANDYVMVQNGYVLTVNSGVTVTNKGGINVYYSTLENNGTIANSGYIGGLGWYTGSGKLTGTAHQIEEVVRTTMTQAEFEAALESSGGWYTLTADVTITEDYATPEGYGFWVDSLGSLTIAEGVTFTANGQLSTGIAPITINGTLISNMHMSVDSSGSKGGITVSETGTLVNNSQLLVASGSLTINGTYSADSTGWVSWDNTNAAIVGEEKIGKENIEIQIIADTEEELIAGMVVQEGYRGNSVYTNADITLNSSLEIPEGLRVTVGYSWREEGAQYQYGLTLAEGVTLTNNGDLNVNERMYLTVGEGAALVNNGSIWVNGKLESFGSFSGNTADGDGTILIHAPAMSQADFAAALAEAAAAGEVYSLTNSVTLTSDMTIDSEVHVEQGASLTVTDGAKLTVAESGHLIASGGTITAKSGAALDIEYLVQVWGGGTLTIESGADITGIQADEIWINLTEPGRNTVTGIADSMLGAIYNPQDAAGIEAAYTNTGTYAHIGVYPAVDITLDRDITIPESDDLNLSEDSGRTLTVPAGFTLTNNGWINISTYNRLEILKGATIVNNGSMYVDQYAQFVVRGTYSGDGSVDGEITYGDMTHEELIAVLEECQTNGHGWVHESETTLETDVWEGVLKISMGEGDPAPQFYLDDGGILRVPSGTRLEVYNPVILIGGQIIVEEGGTLYVNGLLEIQEGTIYIAEGGTLDDSGENCDIRGKITWEGETDTYLSGRWLDEWGEGWFENADAVPDENAGRGISAMSNGYVIFYLKTWDSENLCWITTPVIPTETSQYLTFTRLVDTDAYIKPGEANAEYFVKVEARGTLNHTELSVFVDGVPYGYEIWQRDVAFYTDSYASLDTIIVGNDFLLDTTEGAENTFYLMLNNDGRIIKDITFNVYTWEEDYNALVSDGEFLTQEEVEAGKIWKFTVDPEFTDYVQYDWKNFEVSYVAQVAHEDGTDPYHTGDALWVHPPELLNPKAVFWMNNEEYLFYETGAVFANVFTGEYDEWGNMIMDRQRVELPEGVSYDWETNTMTLNGAALELLSVGYDGSWTDDEGNYVENYRMPSADFTLNLVGSNTITCDNDAALAVWGGANVTITGDGSLYMKSINSPDNVNDQGERYAYQTVHLNDGGNLTVTGSAKVTAEIAGSGFHGDEPAQMHAICGSNNETVAVSGNAALTIVTPEGMRTLDESQDNYGGTRGMIAVNIEVHDNATLNCDTIYLWDGVDFTQNGGTVNVNAVGEVFYNPNKDVYYVSNLGVYMEEADSTFTLNGGTMNIDVTPSEADSNYAYAIFMGMNAQIGDIHINGGTLNINGASETEGYGIQLVCGWNENGPVADAPTGNLYVNGGTINIIDGIEGHGGIIAAPYTTVSLKGGTIHADYSESYLEGNVTWDGTVFNGTAAVIGTYGPGEFTMNSGEINLIGEPYINDNEELVGNALFEANGSGKICGGTIHIENGTFRNNMNIGIEGGEITITNDWDGLAGIENNLYLPIVGGTVKVTANGTAIQNNGTFHQMGGTVTAVNTTSEMPVMVSGGSTLLNEGTLNLSGGNIGIVQAYDFDVAADEEEGNESMLFVGQMDGGAPYLNISNTEIGVYANGPVCFNWGSNVNIEVEGTPENTDRQWPMAIYVEKHTGNMDLTGDNVSSLYIDGGANVNLTSVDTAGVDAMSKGIVAWYAPVTIQGFTDDSGEYWAPNVTIDAEMAVYSATDSMEQNNFTMGEDPFRSLISGQALELSGMGFGDGYIHSLYEADGSYAGRVKISGSNKISGLEAFKALLTYNEESGRYSLSQSVTVGESFSLDDMIVDVVNGGELIILDGAVLTIPEGSHLVAQVEGTIIVEAGGQVVNYGIFASDHGGRIQVSDCDGYAGYVHGSEQAALNVHYRNGVMSTITGIPYEMQTLRCDGCNTTDQIQAALGIENLERYGSVHLTLYEGLELAHNLTIPENMEVYVAGAALTVPAGVTLTMNGYLNLNSEGVSMTVNGTLLNNGQTDLNWATVTVNGTFTNKQPIFINDGSVVNICGTMNSYAPVHVGFWKNDGAAYDAGILNIAEGGVMNNHDYLNICADEYVAEEDRYRGGVVNVYGTLNNLNDEGFGFIEHHGELNIDGSLYNKNVIGMGGTTVVNGTLTNYYDCSIDVYSDVTIYGTLDNSGSFWMSYSANVTAASGSVFGNYASVRNGGTGALRINGTYIGEGELVQDYFENGTVAPVYGLENAQITLYYEGASEAAVIGATEYAKNNDYSRCRIWVTGDLTISEDTLLCIEENFELFVVNNSAENLGSLTVYGSIVNLGALSSNGADVTIHEGGSIYNENYMHVSNSNFGVGVLRTPVVTVNGVLENEHTGYMGLTGVEVINNGTIQNNLVGGVLGELKGVEIADQTLWSNITEGEGEDELAAIMAEADRGYGSAVVWMLTDVEITGRVDVPENVGLHVGLNAEDDMMARTVIGANLTVAENAKLYIQGSAYIHSGSSVINNGRMGANMTVLEGASAINNATMLSLDTIDVQEGASLVNNSIFENGDNTLKVTGEYVHGENAVLYNGWGLNNDTGRAYLGTISGIDKDMQTLFHPIRDSFTRHNETSMATLASFVKAQGYAGSAVWFANDYSFEKDFTIPETMEWQIGAYISEELYTPVTVLISEGKTLTNEGNIDVRTHSKLLVKGILAGNGTSSGDVDTAAYITQEEFQKALDLAAAGDGVYELEKRVVLSQNLTIPANVHVSIATGGELIVLKNVTLTVDGSVNVTPAGALDVYTGGVLVNNGIIDVNATPGNGYLNVSGTYTHKTGALFSVNYALGSVETVTGNVPKNKQVLMGYVFTEQEVTGMVALFQEDGYAGAQIYASGVTLTEDLTIPKKAALVVYDSRMDESVDESYRKLIISDGVTVTVNGELAVMGPLAEGKEASQIVNNGSVILNSGSCLYAYGEFTGNAPINQGGKVYPAAAGVTIEAQNGTAFDVYDPDCSAQLKVTVESAEEAMQTLQYVTWTSSNKNIVDPADITMNEDGTYTVRFAGAAVGTVTLTATTIDGSRKTAKIELSTSYLDAAKKLTAAVDATADTNGLQPGEKIQMHVFGSDTEKALDAANLTFTSSNEEMATVDENGVITGGTKAGTVKITAAIDGDPLKRTVSVSVKVIAAQTADLELAHDIEDQESADAVALDLAVLNGEAYSFTIAPIPGYAEFVTEDVKPTLTKTSFKWTSSDTKLATVTANADGTATVTIKAGAHGVCAITAVSNDLAKTSAAMEICVMDYTPRLGASSVTLNPMLSTGAQVALVASYGNEIDKVSIADDRLAVSYDKDNGMLTIYAADADEVLANGTINTTLRVETGMGVYEGLALKVTVKSTTPSITLKQNEKMDLFYTDSEATLTVAAKDATVVGLELDTETNDDFALTYDPDTGMGTIQFSDSYIEDHSAKPVTKATLRIYLDGYAYPVEKTVTISTTTSKVTLSTSPTSSIVNTALSNDYRAFFYVYNSTEKKTMVLKYEDIESVDAAFVDKYNVADDGQVSLTLNSSDPAGGTAKINVQLDNWMNPVTVTHKITIQTALPTVKLGATTLKLSNVFTSQRAETTAALSQGNMEISGFDNDNVFVSSAAAGTAARTEADKISVKYVNEEIVAELVDPENAPKAGTYTYTATPYIVNSEGESVALKTVTIKVSVNATVPKAKLSATTLKLNSWLFDEDGNSMETGKVTVSLTNSTGYEMQVTGFAEMPDGTSYEDENVVMTFTPDKDTNGGILSVQLKSPEAAKTQYTLTPVVQDEAGSGSVELTALKLTVQPYYNEKLTVSQSASGKLDAIVPDSAIVYTVSKISNTAGEISDVQLLNADGNPCEDFSLSLGENDALKQTITLSKAEGMEYATNVTYKVKLRYTICGKEVDSAVLSIKVSQSALKLTVPTVQYYQSQSLPMSMTVSLTSPVGAEIEKITVNESKTSKELIAALGSEAHVEFCKAVEATALMETEERFFYDPCNAEVKLNIQNPGSLTAGKSYTLYLDVTPTDCAANVNPTALKVTVKVSK